MLMPSIFGEDLFDEFFNDFARPVRGTVRYNNPSNNVMRTDVKEHKDSYELVIELPGYKKENVKAELKEGYLTITAATNTANDQKDENGKYIRRERYAGSCSRSFFVGKDIKQTDIKARFEDGILTLMVPKLEARPQVEENHFITIEG